MNERLINEFKALGSSQKNAVITLQVYLELIEIKKYWDVEYKFCQSLNMMYLTGKAEKNEKISVFIPVPASSSFSFKQMQDWVKIRTEENIKSIYLALVSSDMTCVYYEISDGLKEPTSIDVKHLRVNRREINDDKIKQSRKMLEQAALLGAPVTINLPSNSNQTQNRRKGLFPQNIFPYT